MAAKKDWRIHLGHCFQRTLLDAACGGVWSHRISGRPAYRHAPDDLLRKAVALGEDVLAGQADLRALNQQSLVWRGKAHRP